MSEPSTAEAQRAMEVAADESIPVSERVDMLVEIAVSLQRQPKTPEELRDPVRLYERALELIPADQPIARGRVLARQGSALHQIPGEGNAPLHAALRAFEEAAPLLKEAPPEELAESEMNRGVVLQALAGAGEARIADAIGAYHAALRTFARREYPIEFAIIHNNLATAYLSIPLAEERHTLRETLAVQSFEQALQVVSSIEHPDEYAMLQNNLGNALQYSSGEHALVNNLRAIEAYDEALRVRTRAAAPLLYANTIANKANALSNLPDDVLNLERGNPRNRSAARELYLEAAQLFAEHGADERARYARDTAAAIALEVEAAEPHGV